MAPHFLAIRVAMLPFLVIQADLTVATARLQSFTNKLILHGRRIDWRAVMTLDIEIEMIRLLQLQVHPYRQIFAIEESVYEELVCQFFATFEHHTELVTFR